MIHDAKLPIENNCTDSFSSIIEYLGATRLTTAITKFKNINREANDNLKGAQLATRKTIELIPK